ncbi:hypothetical protein A7D21_32865 [Pseudomonas sp. AP19]|nr:hypothetical protein A7D21_32865 [Pseudomonas sp. AP19]
MFVVKLQKRLTNLAFRFGSNILDCLLHDGLISRKELVQIVTVDLADSMVLIKAGLTNCFALIFVQVNDLPRPPTKSRP